jgi:hypothetical protein
MKPVSTSATLLAAIMAVAFPLQPNAQIRLNPAGEGQALHLPWYTVKDGQTTLISVRNAQTDTKAVRVTVAESLNGTPVGQFNVYLKPNDSWTAALEFTAGGAQLRSLDRSCVAPAGIGAGIPLSYLANRDECPRDANRLRTGSIDIVEMGTVTGAAQELVAAFNCEPLQVRWSAGIWRTSPQLEISPPTGGLSANATVLNLAEGTSFTLSGVAIDGFSVSPRHFNPVGGAPVSFALAECMPSCSVQLPTGEVVQETSGEAAVTRLLMTRQLHEEIHVESGLAAKTMWIVSFPTRLAYSTGEGGNLLPPFGGSTENGKACQAVEWRAWSGDGELAFPVGPELVFIGAARCDLVLCDQTQAVEVQESDDYPFTEPPPECYFASRAQELHVLPLHGLDGGRGVGHLFLGMTAVEEPEVPFDQVSGLPAIGVSVSTFVNANAQPGVLATFNTTAPLRSRD